MPRPKWILNENDTQVRLTTEDILCQGSFREKWLECTLHLLPVMCTDDYAKFIKNLLWEDKLYRAGDSGLSMPAARAAAAGAGRG